MKIIRKLQKYTKNEHKKVFFCFLEPTCYFGHLLAPTPNPFFFCPKPKTGVDFLVDPCRKNKTKNFALAAK